MPLFFPSRCQSRLATRHISAAEQTRLQFDEAATIRCHRQLLVHRELVAVAVVHRELFFSVRLAVVIWTRALRVSRIDKLVAVVIYAITALRQCTPGDR